MVKNNSPLKPSKGSEELKKKNRMRKWVHRCRHLPKSKRKNEVSLTQQWPLAHFAAPTLPHPRRQTTGSPPRLSIPQTFFHIFHTHPALCVTFWYRCFSSFILAAFSNLISCAAGRAFWQFNPLVLFLLLLTRSPESQNNEMDTN